MAIPLIGAAAMAAGRVVAKKLSTRVVAGITGAGAKQVAPVYRNMETGSVKVVSNKGMQSPSNSMGDKRPQASLPVNSLARGKNAVKVNSNPMRGK